MSKSFIKVANAYMKARYGIDLYDTGLDDEEILRISEGETPIAFVKRLGEKTMSHRLIHSHAGGDPLPLTEPSGPIK